MEIYSKFIHIHRQFMNASRSLRRKKISSISIAHACMQLSHRQISSGDCDIYEGSIDISKLEIKTNLFSNKTRLIIFLNILHEYHYTFTRFYTNFLTLIKVPLNYLNA